MRNCFEKSFVSSSHHNQQNWRAVPALLDFSLYRMPKAQVKLPSFLPPAEAPKAINSGSPGAGPHKKGREDDPPARRWLKKLR